MYFVRVSTRFRGMMCSTDRRHESAFKAIIHWYYFKAIRKGKVDFVHPVILPLSTIYVTNKLVEGKAIPSFFFERNQCICTLKWRIPLEMNICWWFNLKFFDKNLKEISFPLIPHRDPLVFSSSIMQTFYSSCSAYYIYKYILMIWTDF